MFDEKVSGKQFFAWMLAALAGPIVLSLDGNFLGAFLMVTLLCVLCWISVRWGTHPDSKVYRMFQIGFLTLVLSHYLEDAAMLWPTAVQGAPVIPVTLLALGTVAAAYGTEACARGVGVLFWAVFGLLSVSILSGFNDIRPDYLAVRLTMPSTAIGASVLLSAVFSFLPGKQRSAAPFLWVALFSGVVSVWIAGTLSPKLAQEVSWPFYEATKSVQLFDVAKRFEALISVAATISYHSLYCLLLCAIRELGGKCGEGAVVLCTAAAVVLMLVQVSIPSAVFGIGGLVFWVFLPLTSSLRRIKNVNKCADKKKKAGLRSAAKKFDEK